MKLSCRESGPYDYTRTNIARVTEKFRCYVTVAAALLFDPGAVYYIYWGKELSVE
jgi:hypothetical protein